jgi:hypothetical protein
MKIGDQVSWKSSSAGTTLTKRGVIVLVIPPASKPRFSIEKYMEGQHARDINARPMRLSEDLTRREESYVVEVKNKKHGAKLYWPLVSLLSQTPSLPVAKSEKAAVAC